MTLVPGLQKSVDNGLKVFVSHNKQYSLSTANGTVPLTADPITGLKTLTLDLR